LDGALVCRGVRGAITVNENTSEAIINATYELLATIVRLNGIHPDDVTSVYFTTTQDLNATYPALAARQLGWYDVALICGHEMNVPDGLPLCIRILIHWNTTLGPQEIQHVYLREAVSLRPDRVDPPLRPLEPADSDSTVPISEVQEAMQ
jgi:chorismate mutase